ncbi:MAG TPA: Sec-independent protein translocase protein TatB [Steroidobacteraceae bacterium]|nr:Sec-independent protein translocase protein TatB [Steroidobacteraceae bacterium]
MFEGRFSEVLIIFVLALVVLGPEKLPRVVAEVGRWVGRARAMARQFREQLEEEVQLEQARRTQAQNPPTPDTQAPAHNPPPGAAASTSAASTPVASPTEPERPPTFSHAHPTDATGASTLAAAPATATPSADERGT